MAGRKPPKAPGTLRLHGEALWVRLHVTHEFSAAEEALAEVLCSTFDQWHDATDAVNRDGLFVEDRFGSLRAHPAAGVIKDSTAALGRLAAQLDLELDDDDQVVSPFAAKPGRRSR